VDGVHFTIAYKAICFGLIVDTSIRDHEALFHRLQPWPVESDADPTHLASPGRECPPPISDSENEDTEEDDDRDYRRRRNKDLH